MTLSYLDKVSFIFNSPSSFISIRARSAPLTAIASAIAAPIPLADPVTIATLPLSLNVYSSYISFL